MATLAFLDNLATVGDPGGTRTVTAIVALLIAMGIAMVMVAVWLFRTTRPDPEVLAPLEVMGDRRWRRSDPVWQRRRLDEVRPEGAEPLARAAAPPELDAAGDVDAGDDGSDASAASVDPDPTPPAGLTSPGADADHAPIATPLAISRPDPATVDDIGDERGDRLEERDDARDDDRELARLAAELPVRELPPEVLAQAMAELDAEMRSLAERRAERHGQRTAADLADLPSLLDPGVAADGAHDDAGDGVGAGHDADRDDAG